jgi:CBS domain-containing protein
MRPNPVWIRPDATVKEAAALLADKRIGAVPVLEEGRPIGVLSQSDLVGHCREMVEFLSTCSEDSRQVDGGECPTKAPPPGFKVVDVDRTLVRDIMAPHVFSVAPETPVARVIEELLARRVHRLLVVSREGILVGIISAVDVLRYLYQGGQGEEVPT